MRITDHKFFTVDAVDLAQKLLGKILVRNIKNRTLELLKEDFVVIRKI